MTGSGALVFGLFEDEQAVCSAAQALEKANLGRVYKFSTCFKGR